MTDLKNETEKYTSLIEDIESGQLKIPQFQRKFVWDLKQSSKLIDSIIKGYPIGTFIFWRTDERLRSIRNIGNIQFPDPKDGEYVNYVLDGQQRITTIYAILKGVKILKEDNKNDDYSAVYIDLEADETSEIVITDIEGKPEKTYIKIVDLLEGNRRLLNEYDEKYDDLLELYKMRLTSYNFAVISLKNASIAVATEVFTRLNIGGKSLTLFEIMVAKTYDEKRSFDLSDKYDDLIDELRSCQYDTLSDATVLQTVSMLLQKDCTRKTILLLDKSSFIDIWDHAIDSIRTTIDFFIDKFGIQVSKLLPYNALIVPFAYFFFKYKEKPTGEVLALLTDYFWRASLGHRFSSGVEGKILQDVLKMDKIMKAKAPKYEWGIEVEPEDIINNGWFSTGRSYIKAILAILVDKGPRSFDDNRKVRIDNSWLKIASSKNYHHFFPKSYMQKIHKEFEFWQYNNIVNITIVDDYLNKNKIRDKAPSRYIKDFLKENTDIEKTLRTHLINDIDKFGISTDDYSDFMKERSVIISREIKKRIVGSLEHDEKLVYYEEYSDDEVEQEEME